MLPGFSGFFSPTPAPPGKVETMPRLETLAQIFLARLGVARPASYVVSPLTLLFSCKSCLTLCDPMDFSTTGFLPLFHCLWSLLKFMSPELVMLSNHLNLCCPLLLLPSIFPIIRVFSMSWFFALGVQSIGASTSATVLPMNIQG